MLALASATLVACGGGGGGDAKQPDPEADVRRTAATLLTTASPTLSCAKLVTARLVKEVYGSQSKCRAAAASEQRAGGKVGDIAISGRSARVRVANGEGQRIAGHVTFVQQAGVWKADRFEDDYVRAALSAQVESATSGILAEPTLRSCVIRKVGSLPAATVRTYAFGGDRKDPSGREGAFALLMRCPRPLGKAVAGRLMGAVSKTGRSAAELRCIENGMAFTFATVPILARKALNKPSTSIDRAALAGIVKGSIQGCRKRAR